MTLCRGLTLPASYGLDGPGVRGVIKVKCECVSWVYASLGQTWGQVT